MSEPRAVETGTPELLCRVEERVGVVVLNRPEARNALTLAMKEALLELLPRLEADGDVGCVLVTGAGSAFCAGGDTKTMARDGRLPSPGERLELLHREHGIPLLLHRMAKPTIAALPGAAAGAGLGLSGDYGTSWFLTQLVGTARAREILFGADRLDAAACERIGLVNRVAPDEDLAREALAWAVRIAAGPPVALRFMKDNLNRALAFDLEACLGVEAERMVASAQTEDYLEAVRARAEKREPVFRGR